MRAPAGIGFDLGETLLTYADTPPNWSALYPAALQRVADQIRVTPTKAQLDQAALVLARYNTRLHARRKEISAAEIFREVLAPWNLDLASLTAAPEAFFGFFQQRMSSYPETAVVLQALRTRGIRVGVLTDVPYGMPRALVERDLAGAGFTHLVDELLTSVEVGWRKPDPAGFRALATRLGVRESEWWFVGNEEKDIAGALAAGATPVLVDREGRRPTWGQTFTVKNLREIPALWTR